MTEGEKQTPDWPVQDFLLAYEEALTKRSGRNLAVLVFPGSFSPVHMGHMLMLQQATERLDRAGYDVLAGYIVPMAQTGELSTDFRLKAAALAAAKVPKCEVSPWAIRKGPCKDMEVVQALRAALLEETGMSSKAAPRVRVVAVCGADDTRKFSSLKPQDMLGLCIVPKAGEEEFLLEKPLQQNYVAEAPGGELANLDDKLLAEAISGGDAAFLAQALPEGTRRLVLKPTSQELQRFGADLQKLLPKVPESPWPADKLMSKLLSAGPEGAHTWALLILSDTMAPAMKYHLEILAKARARLEQRGYMVIGMWLSPRTDDKTAEPLSREFRLRAANLMVASEELTMIGTWEMDNGKPSAAQAQLQCRDVC
ncbi:unnamed protein product [Effrenium voratum]|nr:unnamed protein product [Effrenium voratum]